MVKGGKVTLSCSPPLDAATNHAKAHESEVADPLIEADGDEGFCWFCGHDIRNLKMVVINAKPVSKKRSLSRRLYSSINPLIFQSLVRLIFPTR